MSRGSIGAVPRGTAASVALAAALGLAAGTGAYTFVYAKGAAYLTDDPAACANCHVMRAEYEGWYQGSHRSAATCNDCHTPGAFPANYATKAANGFWHSVAFTTGRFAEPIRIKARNLAVTEAQCRRCHGDIVAAIAVGKQDAGPRSCVPCHRTVGHRR